MSCERSSRNVSRLVALRCGISQTGSRAAGLYGSAIAARAVGMARRWIDPAPTTLRGLRAAAGAALLVMAAGRGGRARLRKLPGDTVAGMAGFTWRHRREAGVLVGLIGVGRLAAAAGRRAGTAVANLTSVAGGPGVKRRQRRFVFGSREVTVETFRSDMLTRRLNQQDRLVSGRNVLAGRGAFFTLKQTTWHAGLSVIRTAAGVQTISHLQSLSPAGTHYYFDRPLTAEQAVGLAAGELDPRRLPGYAGQLRPAESLLPTWAAVKHTVIRAGLHWPVEEKDVL